MKPEPDHSAQLLSLSDQIRKGELFVVLDIPPDALRPSGDGKREQVRYYTNSGGLVDQMGLWLPAAVNEGLRRVRLTQLGVDPARLPGVLSDVPVVSMNLVSQDPAYRENCARRKEKSDSVRRCSFFPGLLDDHGHYGGFGAQPGRRGRR